MTTAEKTAKIAAYYVKHRSDGMSADEAIDHIAGGLGVARGTVLVAIHLFINPKEEL